MQKSIIYGIMKGMAESPKDRPDEQKTASLPAEVETTVATVTRNDLSGTMHARDSAESGGHILTREAVLREMDWYAKEYVIQRELLDEHGLLLLEAIRTTDNPQELIEYTYRRKGMYGKHQVDRTTIEMTIYDDGMPESGSVISEYDEATKAWTPRAIEFADSIQAELDAKMR